MSNQLFGTDDAPHVFVRTCADKVDVVGWQRQSVTVEGEGAKASTQSDGIMVDSDGELRIMMPINGRLTLKTIAPIPVTIKHVHGDISIESCGALTVNNFRQVQAELVDGELVGENGNGRLYINHAADTVTLRRVDAVQIKQADGDVSIQFATGFVDLGQANGSVSLNSINGDVVIGQAMGDTTIKNVGGLNTVTTDGLLTLRGTFAHGEHRFTSAGDMVLDWPDAPLSPVTLLATAVSIQNDLPLVNAEETAVDGMTQLNGHIEQGKPFLILKTNGRLHLMDGIATKPLTAKKHPYIIEKKPMPTPVPHTQSGDAPNPETRRHILQLLKDDLISINQAELLLSALDDD